MVIQRWQSVLLFLAAVMMALFVIFPLGHSASSEEIFVFDNIAYGVLNAAVALLLLVDIFLYSNLKLQMRVALICMLLQAVSIFIGGRYYFMSGFESSLAGIPLVAISLVLTFFGRRLIDKDRKLLASADRLR